MSRAYSTALPLVVALLFVFLTFSAHNENVVSATTEAPIPTYLPFFKVFGFAGAMNYKFNLMVSEEVDPSHSLILTAMAFRETDFMSSIFSRSSSVIIKATYTMKEGGGEVTVTSDRYGYVEITNIAVGQAVSVEVLREMDSAYDVPFRFYSMQANVDHRYIVLQPQETFRMPVPYTLRSGKPYTLTFKAVPPYDDGEIGFQVQTSYSAASLSMTVTSCSAGSTAPQELKPSTIIGWNGQSPAYVTITPKTYMVDLTMDWPEKPAGTSLSPAAVCTTSITSNPAGGTHDGSASNGGTKGTTPGDGIQTTSTAAPHKSITANGFSVLLIILLVTITYFTIATLINVKLRGITTYPEMVPHINEMRAARDYFGNVSQSMRAGGRAGYSEVDRRGEADISNY